MRKMKISIIPMCFFMALILIEPAPAQYLIKKSVVGNGGIRVNNNHHRLVGTLGQPAIGIINSPTHINNVGFWYQSANMITSIESISNFLPKEFRLKQNYPNPFNPTTTIQYDLPKSGDVHLVIYNLQGRHIRTLVDAQQQAGYLHTTWDSTDEQNLPVSTGVYFCRMQVGEFLKVIKLSLVR